MAYYVVYTDTTGPILRSGQCADADVASQANPDLGEQVMTTPTLKSATRYYMLNSAVTAKTAFPGTWDKTTITADFEDVATFSAPTVTTPVSDQVMFSTGGNVMEMWDPTALTCTILVDTPGNYQLQLDSFPYLLYTQVIKAV